MGALLPRQDSKRLWRLLLRSSTPLRYAQNDRRGVSGIADRRGRRSLQRSAQNDKRGLIVDYGRFQNPPTELVGDYGPSGTPIPTE